MSDDLSRTYPDLAATLDAISAEDAFHLGRLVRLLDDRVPEEGRPLYDLLLRVVRSVGLAADHRRSLIDSSIDEIERGLRDDA